MHCGLPQCGLPQCGNPQVTAEGIVAIMCLRRRALWAASAAERGRLGVPSAHGWSPPAPHQFPGGRVQCLCRGHESRGVEPSPSLRQPAKPPVAASYERACAHSPRRSARKARHNPDLQRARIARPTRSGTRRTTSIRASGIEPQRRRTAGAGYRVGMHSAIEPRAAELSVGGASMGMHACDCGTIGTCVLSQAGSSSKNRSKPKT